MKVNDTRTRRVIIDSDVKNEADDQFAVVHALLSPTLDIRGIIPAHFGTHKTDRSMEESREELIRIYELSGLSAPIADGAPTALREPGEPVDSEGARLIIQEALREDAGPLFIAFLGPLTDMASALLLAPEIARTDTTVVWIGGPPYGDRGWRGKGPEFNLRNDIIAANVVFASGIAIQQIPADVYRLMNVGYAELRRRVAPHGAIGAYLAQTVVDYNTAHHPSAVESRALGDSPAIGVLLDPRSATTRKQTPVRFTLDGHCVPAESGSVVSVVEQVDTRWILEDMFAKFADHAERRG